MEERQTIRKTALITGASTGIGRELARVLAREHYDLVLVARDEERLKAVADECQSRHGVNATVVVKDLSEPTAADELFEDVRSRKIVVDVLVNNAGFGVFGPFTTRDLASERAMVQTNLVSLMVLTKHFVREMVNRRSGRILNVASTAAFQPGPLMAVYYASKSFVLSFSEALAEELRGTGVTVTALCPGPTHTEFHKRAGMEELGLLGLLGMDARTVAESGVKGLMRGRSIVIPGFHNRLLALAVRWIPRSVTRRVLMFIQWTRQVQHPQHISGSSRTD